MTAERHHDPAERSTRSPEQIENEIDSTRASMAATIAAIERKLSPGELLDEFMGVLKRGTKGAGSGLARTAKDNPVPLALIGAGVVWLVSSRASSGQSREHADEGFGEFIEPRPGVREKIGTAAETARSAVSERVGSVRASARDVGAATRERISGMTSRAGEAAQRQAHRVRSGANRLFHEEPFVLAAVGIAAGALLGALLPSTRREDELLGASRDELLGTVAEKVGEGAERAAQVAKAAGQAAAETARSEADRQGLTGSGGPAQRERGALGSEQAAETPFAGEERRRYNRGPGAEGERRLRMAPPSGRERPSSSTDPGVPRTREEGPRRDFRGGSGETEM